MSILLFPVELLQEIAKLTSSLPVLRLVCKRFNDVVVPQMFSHASIWFEGEKQNQYPEYLKALATTAHPAVVHAKSLTFRHLSPQLVLYPKYPRDEEEEAKLKLQYKLDVLDPYYAHSQLIKEWFPLAMNRFNQATTLMIKSYHEQAVPLVPSLLQQTSHMNLKHLSLEGFHVILNSDVIPRLRSLESLCVNDVRKGMNSYSRWPQPNLLNPSQEIIHSTDPSQGDLWRVLKAGKIHLQEITIDEPTESFVQYLGSYTGLKRLTIRGAKNSDQTKSDTFAINFYRNALLPHASTLEKLVILPFYEGKWCFGEQCIRVLSGLVNLTHLSISIVADSSKIMHGIEWWPPKVPEGPCEYNPLHPVCLLMQTAASLPKLELLSIHGSSLPSNRGVQCGNGLKRHAIKPTTQIYTHVTSTGPLDPSKFKYAIENSGVYLRPQRLEESGEYWYR
ncbi:hypothetical protein BDQ17DRAFT_1412463 [Cyathus striatus]|nr:hypothetical protein BDQ17DRAFT_1412463 [Cyathus striatus]